MALGILKDEATYYEDSEKYTGDSGSSTNMWVVEDIYDFVKAINPTDITNGSIHIKLVNDIDFNDHSTYKRGISNTLHNANKFYLYGDNHKIKNLVALNANSAILDLEYIEKIDFVNLVSINSNKFPVYGNVIECNFGVFVSNSAMGFGKTDTPIRTIDDSTFNIRGTTTGNELVYVVPGWKFNVCHFNFDITVPFAENGAVFKSGANSEDVKADFTNCYFTGKVNSTSIMDKYYFALYVSFTSCYYAFEWNEEYSSWGGYDSTFANCFIDKELFEENGAKWISLGGISELTTAQAQNADYLNSIGFLVVPVE